MCASDLARVRAPHGVFGILDGLEWLPVVAGHEARQAEQIAEVAHALGGR